MTINEEFDNILNHQMMIIDEEILNFFNELVKASPVDTGSFKSAWAIDKVNENEWIITNDVEYASILWDGRRFVAGKFEGSEQWAEGGRPMLEKLNRTIQRRLDEV